MAASKRDTLLALGLPDPGDDAAPDSEGAEGTDDSDREAQENDAIDEVFATKDPAARREAFRRAVELCTKSY